jgi:hypothetical protein
LTPGGPVALDWPPMLAYDRSLRSKDIDGRLHVEICNISKATVNPYWGREIPDYQKLGLHPNQLYQLYRDPKELEKAAATFNNLPLLVKHVPISAEDPAVELVVGTTGSATKFEYPYLKSSLAVWTQDAIDLIESGEREQLSPGYRYTADMTRGVSPDGLHYDGVMRNIVGNHVAIVPIGRTGPDVVVPDELPTELYIMRFPKFIAAFTQLFATTPDIATQIALDEAFTADLLAFDARKDLSEDEQKAACDAMAKELGKACDALSDEEKDEAYKRAAKDKKGAAHDAATTTIKVALDATEVTAAINAAVAEAKTAMDAALVEAKAAGIEEGKALAKAEAERIAQDAQTAATALAAARTEVEPIVGEVTCDTAEAVYEHALKSLKVTLDGVPPSAYAAMFRVASKSAAAPAPVHTARIAADAAAVFPIISNIRRG